MRHEPQQQHTQTVGVRASPQPTHCFEKPMIITLSPSKGQDFETTSLSKTHTKPADLKDSELLIKELKKLNSEQLQTLMVISENIANLNVERNKT